MCNRIAMRMECPECGYPYCEANIPLDKSIEHDLYCCPIHGYKYLKYTSVGVYCDCIVREGLVGGGKPCPFVKYY